ncbi:hypothetical protein EYF80_024951 [Liparis tanakae]|uniref:Uncharacterized protein n=1 Tax=Liparis tanakae TaxID=230148 RepID=A0A4Z2HH55_9TELE|nr:hypothetical protein EYF80_024951 [Liparis tanakae]
MIRPEGSRQGSTGLSLTESYPVTSAPSGRVTNRVSGLSRRSGPSLTESKTLGERDSEETKSIHHQPEVHFLVRPQRPHPGCNRACPAVPIAHQAKHHFLSHVFGRSSRVKS